MHVLDLGSALHQTEQGEPLPPTARLSSPIDVKAEVQQGTQGKPLKTMLQRHSSAATMMHHVSDIRDLSLWQPQPPQEMALVV